MGLGVGDLLDTNKKISVINFETLLPAAWGAHGDFLEGVEPGQAL